MTDLRYPVAIERAQLEARFEIVGHHALIADILRAAGLPIPANASTAASGADGMRVLWVGPRRAIVAARLETREQVRTALRSALPTNAAVAAADVTGSTVTFVLNGKGANDVLAQGIAHDIGSLSEDTERIIATDAWGTAAILERRRGQTLMTVDTTISAYIEHMLRTAAGLTASSKPGVMQAPPPPIRTSR